MNNRFANHLHPRQQLLHATSFDRDRALQRLNDSHPELAVSAESRAGIRLDKDKRCVDRDTVFVQVGVDAPPQSYLPEKPDRTSNN